MHCRKAVFAQGRKIWSARNVAQALKIVLVSVPLGLDDFPAEFDRAPSTMLDDDKTRPGDAKTGAGLLTATVVWAKVVSPKASLKVTPMV